ncbi:hypothetical protein OAU50_03035 [Planctomycetota bacterium]|nr:hypothetical protein [Planctomycetota bacterium]
MSEKHYEKHTWKDLILAGLLGLPLYTAPAMESKEYTSEQYMMWAFIGHMICLGFYFVIVYQFGFDLRYRAFAIMLSAASIMLFVLPGSFG